MSNYTPYAAEGLIRIKLVVAKLKAKVLPRDLDAA
jgi:hypothetical protein